MAILSAFLSGNLNHRHLLWNPNWWASSWRWTVPLWHPRRKATRIAQAGSTFVHFRWKWLYNLPLCNSVIFNWSWCFPWSKQRQSFIKVWALSSAIWQLFCVEEQLLSGRWRKLQWHKKFLWKRPELCVAQIGMTWRKGCGHQWHELILTLVHETCRWSEWEHPSPTSAPLCIPRGSRARCPSSVNTSSMVWFSSCFSIPDYLMRSSQLNNKTTKPGTTHAPVDCVWTPLVECQHQGGRTIMEQLLKRTPELWHGCSRLSVCPQRQCNWIGNLFLLHSDTLR